MTWGLAFNCSLCDLDFDFEAKTSSKFKNKGTFTIKTFLDSEMKVAFFCIFSTWGLEMAIYQFWAFVAFTKPIVEKMQKIRSLSFYSKSFLSRNALIFVFWACFGLKIQIKATKAAIKGQTLGQIFSNVDFMVVPICVHPPIVPFFHLDIESITDISTALWYAWLKSYYKGFDSTVKRHDYSNDKSVLPWSQ